MPPSSTTRSPSRGPPRRHPIPTDRADASRSKNGVGRETFTSPLILTLTSGGTLRSTPQNTRLSTRLNNLRNTRLSSPSIAPTGESSHGRLSPSPWLHPKGDGKYRRFRHTTTPPPGKKTRLPQGSSRNPLLGHTPIAAPLSNCNIHVTQCPQYTALKMQITNFNPIFNNI